MSVSCSVTLDFPFAEFRAKIQRSGGSSSAALISEVARLLKKYPVFNAVYHDGQVGFYEEINIGWAIDDGAGLVVPVVAGADLKTLDGIDVQLQEYFAAYVRNRLSPNDLRNPTFNISDLSGEGVSHFVPLIRRGHGAILGVGADSFTLSFDHQIAEGRTAANFLQDVIARLSSFERDLAGVGQGAADRSESCCVGCRKDAAELQAANVFLLRYESAKPGLICSLCLNGY
jgi:pyruvate/2-oxoglutarate dehydrogenase complex dihydrolipoamide acyltransferase (E2) component